MGGRSFVRITPNGQPVRELTKQLAGVAALGCTVLLSKFLGGLVVASVDFESTYDVQLTGREIYWLIHLANKELKRLQDFPADELINNPLKQQQFNQRYEPISGAFNKLIAIG
jgi:hypothetical protein